MSTHAHIFVTLCLSCDTPSENTGLRQLRKVSCAFKSDYQTFPLMKMVPAWQRPILSPWILSVSFTRRTQTVLCQFVLSGCIFWYLCFDLFCHWRPVVVQINKQHCDVWSGKEESEIGKGDFFNWKLGMWSLKIFPTSVFS